MYAVQNTPHGQNLFGQMTTQIIRPTTPMVTPQQQVPAMPLQPIPAVPAIAGAAYVPMPPLQRTAGQRQRSTAPAVPYQYSLIPAQAQHVLTATPQPNPNVVGSWPVAMNFDPNVNPTSSQR